jgi:hypothetical protein
MMSLRVTTTENLMGTCFGCRLLGIITALSLPTPIIKGSQIKFQKKGVCVITVVQIGRETKLSRESFKFRLLHIDQLRGIHIALQG